MLKALAKDPADRYATAGELAADLALFLADQPIRARPPTLARAGGRWARRRWKAVAAAGLMAAVMLIGLVGASLWSNARLRAINQRLEGRSTGPIGWRGGSPGSGASSRSGTRLGAQLRLAAQAIDAAQPERAQEILRDIPLNAGGEAPRSFAWRYLWHRARREVVCWSAPRPTSAT